LHQEKCPLLEDSKNDWCHDRTHFEKPEALQKIENLLPIKNDTLTYSYLFAKKDTHKFPPSPSKVNSTSKENISNARVIGDFLNEKGKTRQMVCRSPKREFLTQLKRHSQPTQFQRGDILSIDGNAKIIGNEIRVNNVLSVIKNKI
jgi:hypothetical protein